MIEGNIVEHGAVELQDIVPTVVVVIQKFHRYATQQHCFISDARVECVIGECSIVVVVIEPIQFEVEMSDVNVLPSVAVHVGRIDAHAGLVAPILAGGDSRHQGDVFEGSVVPVDKKKIRPRVVGDGNVGPTVIVEVGQNYAHAFCFGLADSRCVAHVGESSVVIVVVEFDALALVVARMAVRAVTGSALAAPHVVLRTPVDVIRDHQIEPAVFVVIKPSCTGRPSTFVCDAGLCRHIRERSVAIVVIENGTTVTGHI